MTVNLVKMCVGIDDIDELRFWQAKRLKSAPDKKLQHVTRHRPKREEELLDGGSIYWVIKGVIQARQKLLGTVWPASVDANLSIRQLLSI